MKVLVVVDMQKDFVDGALGSPEAQAIVPNVVAKVKEYAEMKDGLDVYTRDTHFANYIDMLCDEVTSCGAEGLMINRPFANYEHKRTNVLLK